MAPRRIVDGDRTDSFDAKLLHGSRRDGGGILQPVVFVVVGRRKPGSARRCVTDLYWECICGEDLPARKGRPPPMDRCHAGGGGSGVAGGVGPLACRRRPLAVSLSVAGYAIAWMGWPAA